MKKIELTENLMKRILENEVPETGVFISILIYWYIQTSSMTKRQFFKSLKNSLRDIDEIVKEKCGEKDGSLGA